MILLMHIAKGVKISAQLSAVETRPGIRSIITLKLVVLVEVMITH